MTETVSVPSRFNGPPASGNGGYSCALVQRLVGETTRSRLRRPVPMDTPMTVDRDPDGSVRLSDVGELVAEGSPWPEFELELPAPVSVDDARAATERYRGLPDGQFSECFVCGLARGDGFGVFAGEVEGRDLVASPWTPPAWTADESGEVGLEFIGAVLDCPTYFALYSEGELPLSFLGQLTIRHDAPVSAEEEHVVIAWPIGRDGRKHLAGSAILTAAGEPLARAEALLIAAE